MTQLTALTRAEMELRMAYENEQLALRSNLVNRMYHNAELTLADWSAFQDAFEVGGRYETLADQFDSDMDTGITDTDVTTIVSAMTDLIAAIDAIETRVPGTFVGL